jgi:hypothetical protein
LVLAMFLAQFGIVYAQTAAGASAQTRPAKGSEGRSIEWNSFCFSSTYGQDEPISEGDAAAIRVSELAAEEFLARIWATGLREGHFELRNAGASLEVVHDRKGLFSRPMVARSAHQPREVEMADLWDKAKEVAKDAGNAVSDAGKAVADTASELSDKAGADASSAWESTKEAASAVADGASGVADSAAKVASNAVEATKAAASDAVDAVDAVKKGLA